MLLVVGLRYPENPPPAHTGGFGEPTCHTCHFDGDINDGVGRLDLRGLDRGYTTNAVYELEVILSRQDMEQAGFQLSARFAKGSNAGRQAGEFLIAGNTMAIDTEHDVSYVRQAKQSDTLIVADSAVWRLQWRSPQSEIPVLFNVVANAANGDDSEFGDAIYSLESLVKSRP